MSFVIVVLIAAVLVGVVVFAVAVWQAKQRTCPGCGRTRVPGYKNCPFCRTPYERAETTRGRQAEAPRLVGVDGLPAGQSFTLPVGQFNIGRAANNQIVLDDPNVEPYHAVIAFQRGWYVLYDYGTPAGTYVNGRRIVQHALRPGDRIQIGSATFDFLAPPTLRSVLESLWLMLRKRETWETAFLKLAGARIPQEIKVPSRIWEIAEGGRVPFLTAGVPMEGVLEASGQTLVKCYHCYSPDVVAVCHHCGRYLCKKCQAKPFSLLQINREFASIKPLDERQRDGAHCPDHQHYEWLFVRFLAIGVFLLGVLLLRGIPGLGIGLMLSGVVLWAAGPWLHQRLVPSLWAPNLPLFPRLQIGIQERIEADFQITEQSYLDLAGASGTFTVRLGLAPVEAERYHSFLVRYGTQVQPAALRFDGGFVALDNLAHVQFEDRHWMKRPGFLQLTEGVPRDFLNLCQGREEFQLAKGYHIAREALREGPDWDWEFPIWIIPTVADRGAGRVLTLEIRLNSSRIPRVTVEELTIYLPPELLRVERTDGWFDVHNQRVVWKNVMVSADKARELTVEFAEPVWEAEAIRGTYRLVIENYAVSGLDVQLDHVWTAAGLPLAKVSRGQRLVERETVITGRLAIDAHVLTSQYEYTTTRWGTQEGVAPDQVVLNRVVDYLTKDRVYVKQVVETPARVARLGDIGTQTRYWEISGRRYDDILPVDVHVVLSGTEAVLADSGPDDSGVKFELTLRSLINPRDDETRKHINTLCNALRDCIQQAIASS